jgi:putative transposase
MTPAIRREAVVRVCEKLGHSERKVCKALDQNRSTQRYDLKMPEKYRFLTSVIKVQIQKRRHRKYGYRRICEILCRMGLLVNHKRIYRLWHNEGLHLKRKVKRGKRKSTGASENACHRKLSEYMDHIWSYDFIEEKLQNKRKIRVLNIVDEFTHECLASEAERRFKGHAVAEVLRYLFIVRGCPEYIRSDNGSEFYSAAVKDVMDEFGVKPLYVKPASPWENGYVESFNGSLRDELLERELFYTLKEAQVLVENWRYEYNTIRPHSSLGYLPPAPETFGFELTACVT